MGIQLCADCGRPVQLLNDHWVDADYRRTCRSRYDRTRGQTVADHHHVDEQED